MSDDETTPEMLARLGTDAMLWAQEFNKTAVKLGYSEMDEGWLIGWFANAIESCDAIRGNRLRADLAAVTAERNAAKRNAYAGAARFIEENVFNYSSTEKNYWSPRKGGDSNGLEYAKEFRARAALKGVTEPPR